MRVRWIAFDAVDTLIRPNPPVADVYHEAGRRHGSRLTREQVASRFREAFAKVDDVGTLVCDCPETDDEGHTCESREELRWRTIVKAVLSDVADPEACFEELFAHFGRPASWSCFADVGPTLAALKEAGFHLAVSSNFDGRLNTVMDGLPPLEPIQLRFISSEVGHRKPSRRFFTSLLAATGCAPEQLIFVGDNPQTDVAAANAVGIPALEINRAALRPAPGLLRSLSEILERLGKRPS